MSIIVPHYKLLYCKIQARVVPVSVAPSQLGHKTYDQNPGASWLPLPEPEHSVPVVGGWRRMGLRHLRAERHLPTILRSQHHVCRHSSSCKSQNQPCCYDTNLYSDANSIDQLINTKIEVGCPNKATLTNLT